MPSKGGKNNYDRRHGYRGTFNNKIRSQALMLVPIRCKSFYTNTIFIITLNRLSAISTILKQVEIFNTEGKNLHYLGGDEMERPFRNDRSQGPNPKKPADILKQGDLIYYYADEKKVLQLAQLPEAEGALVALNPRDGKVEALVGGYDFAKSKFDRTTQAVRQTGSNFKPFLYSAAIASGININSTIYDEPLRTWDRFAPGGSLRIPLIAMTALWPYAKV